MTKESSAKSYRQTPYQFVEILVHMVEGKHSTEKITLDRKESRVVYFFWLLAIYWIWFRISFLLEQCLVSSAGDGVNAPS